jgi:glycosyltransferase involved in cell wall biosynthesis
MASQQRDHHSHRMRSRPRSLRIALLNWRDTGHPEAGGAEVFLTRVSEGLAARGHDVTIRVASYPGAVSDEVSPAGVRIQRRGGRFSIYPRTLGWLARHPHRFDIVLDVQNGVPFWAPLTKLPTINITHHVHREQWPEVFAPPVARFGWWLESRLAPRVYRGCRYIAVSQATRTELADIGVDPARVDVIYSGLDGAVAVLPRTALTTNPSLVVLGRLVPHKRVELAIDAVAALRQDFPGLTLRVVGGGFWAPKLRDHAELRGVRDAVQFTGTVDDQTKHQILAESWVNLLPSLKEGWGLVVLEAAAQGRPTVAFRSAGGTNESVVHDHTGLLVEDAADFTAAVRRLLSDADLLDKYGQAARHHARQFNWDRTTAELEAVINNVLGRCLPALTGRTEPVEDCAAAESTG